MQAMAASAISEPRSKEPSSRSYVHELPGNLSGMGTSGAKLQTAAEGSAGMCTPHLAQPSSMTVHNKPW